MKTNLRTLLTPLLIGIITCQCILLGALASKVFLSSEDSKNAVTQELAPFPAGYIDSPYVVPDGSALYFLHSAASTLHMLTADPSADPVTAFLPDHQGRGGGLWWNTDLYVTYKNPDGTWGQPQNLGPNINTVHMECCMWVNDEQTVLIFSRESVNDPSLSGSFISHRNDRGNPWGPPEKLPEELGQYIETSFSNFHLSPSGNLYFESEGSITAGDSILYWAKATGTNQWSIAQPLPGIFQSDHHDTQLWINDEETVIYFNRRGEEGQTQLLRATRSDPASQWEAPTNVQIRGFADANGNLLWGEPSFTGDGTMLFVRFNTATENWDAELFQAARNEDGSCGPPQQLMFEQ